LKPATESEAVKWPVYREMFEERMLILTFMVLFPPDIILCIVIFLAQTSLLLCSYLVDMQMAI
jgi:hypothetical protein